MFFYFFPEPDVGFASNEVGSKPDGMLRANHWRSLQRTHFYRAQKSMGLMDENQKNWN